MSNTPHELAEDFPDKIDAMHTLKETDGEFRSLSDRYHEINRAIHRAETNVEPISPAAEEDMRKERVAIKDRIAAKLAKV